MIFTRLGYVVIVAIIVAAAAAIYWVLRPESGDGRPRLEVQQVVNYAKFGQVERIEVDGRTLTVHFIDELDTESAFGEDARIFEATLPEDASIYTILEVNGVAVGGAAGVTVTQR
jgi:hypothetical protein